MRRCAGGKRSLCTGAFLAELAPRVDFVWSWPAPAIPFFVPRVAQHVVPGLLPKAGQVLFQELEAAHPFGALPQVEVRHEEARGPAVFRREPLPIMRQGDQVVRAVQVGERQVRRESLRREDEAVLRVGPYARLLEQELHRNSLERVVEPTPARDAVDVAPHGLTR